jgi:predicted transcriptional regulator
VVSASPEASEETFDGPLAEVAEAAGARLRAGTDDDAEAARTAADALTRAATSAMEAGYTLTEIARAEARGNDTIRRDLRADALKLVERTGARARDTQAEHYRAIARATRLGLPMREIAHAAHVTHGTIRAITNRLASRDAGSETVDQQPREDEPLAEREEHELQRSEQEADPRPDHERSVARPADSN